jgi:hypothetical protein
MKTYYGLDDDGAMRHIRLRESMEEWHVRCREQGESIRRLRGDIGTEYSRKDHYRRIKQLEAMVAELDQARADSIAACNQLTAGLVLVAEFLGIPYQVAPVIDGEVRLPCPEHGEDCSSWPVCTN